MSNQIEGRIDEWRLPWIYLRLSGLEDPVQCWVDTGFNRSLLIFEEQARQARLQLNPSRTAKGTLANGTPAPLFLTRGFIEWFAGQKEITILVAPGPVPRGEKAKIGTEILQDSRLEIDFPRQTVHIYRQPETR